MMISCLDLHIPYLNQLEDAMQVHPYRTIGLGVVLFTVGLSPIVFPILSGGYLLIKIAAVVSICASICLLYLGIAFLGLEHHPSDRVRPLTIEADEAPILTQRQFEERIAREFYQNIQDTLREEERLRERRAYLRSQYLLQRNVLRDLAPASRMMLC